MIKSLLSMKMAVFLMFVFGITIGGATFIENDYGTQTAKALIYNARWFEFFLFYFIVILVFNMIKFKSYKSKLPVFIFHLSFFIMAIGAMMTRFVGFEGIMHIREGEVSSNIISDIQTLQISLQNGEDRTNYENPLYLSSMTENNINDSIKVGNKTLEYELIKYIPHVKKEIISSQDDKDSEDILEFKLLGSTVRGAIIPLVSGDEYDAGTFIISYNKKSDSKKPQFIVNNDNGKLTFTTTFPVEYLRMNDKESGKVEAGTYLLEKRYLYQFNNNAVVLKKIYKDAKFDYKSLGLKSKSGKPELLRLKLSVGDKSKVINILSNHGTVGDIQKIKLNGVEIYISYGSKIIPIPFGIKLVKFDLERYPGSMTPSSYASDVILIDKEQNINMPYRIFMNNVLDHRSYRFFQSSYDMDEMGTILSVNHDLGTIPTYIGYLLLIVGMFWSLLLKKGRFQTLSRSVKRLQSASAIILVVGLLFSIPLHADSNNTHDIIYKYDKLHADTFGHLVIQDHQGRMKPVNTISHDIVSKITGQSSILGLSSDQIFLGMLINPMEYQDVPMIKIGHSKIAIALGLDKSAKLARFTDFFTDNHKYKIYQNISDAVRKKPLEKSQYDKELIKIDERVNISSMVYSGSLLSIYPRPNDKNNKWVSPMEAIKTFPSKDAQMIQLITRNYFQGVADGLESGDWTKSDEGLSFIKKYQNSYGNAVIPSERHISMEIWYNNLGLFSRLVPLYLFLGLGLLLFAFIDILKPSKVMSRVMNIAWGILIIGFIIHLIGMALRWYISGHAPWSNAYESIVFIAASTVIAGLFLAKNSPFALAGTALLAGITMAVAHMNFINPEITNLVPVLKSYWLMIHVATIISGDGFLGLGSILSLFVIILFIIRKKDTSKNIDRSI
ncbi:MAG: cytochrome c biogenesis protein ResB, partial [Sulfurovum sp.]|nr:cytochrome c biogenesis protein ResB [Sulfurovaceae bacterium]